MKFGFGDHVHTGGKLEDHVLNVFANTVELSFAPQKVRYQTTASTTTMSTSISRAMELTTFETSKTTSGKEERKKEARGDSMFLLYLPTHRPLVRTAL